MSAVSAICSESVLFVRVVSASDHIPASLRAAMPKSAPSLLLVLVQDISAAAQKGRPMQAGGRCFCSRECASAQPKSSPALEAARKLLPRIAKQHDTAAVLLESVLELQALQLRLHTPPDAAAPSSDGPSQQQGCSASSQSPSEPGSGQSAPHESAMSRLSVTDSNTAATAASSTSANGSANTGPGDADSKHTAQHENGGAASEVIAAGGNLFLPPHSHVMSGHLKGHAFARHIQIALFHEHNTASLAARSIPSSLRSELIEL